MSLGIVIKGPEGMVLAADTRITLTAQQQGSYPLNVNFDNTTKFLTFDKPHNCVAAVTYGDAVIGNRTAHSFVPELELELKDSRDTVRNYAKRISNFFQARWKEAGMPEEPPSGGMTFIVGGYDEDAPYGEVFLFAVPTNPAPEPRNAEGFGMTWGGQLQIANRIIHGYDPALLPILGSQLGLDDSQIEDVQKGLASLEYTIPYDILALQDCVDLATFLIRTTITAQNLAIGLRGVGGTIEVASITRTGGLNWVQKKEIRGEVHS